MESSATVNAKKDIPFAQKPNLIEPLRQKNRPVNLISNYLKISMKPKEAFIQQYAIKIEPEIPNENEPLRRQIYRNLNKQLKDLYHPFLISGDILFSGRLVQEKVTISFSLGKDGEDKEYQITIDPTNNILDLTNIRSNSNFSQCTKSFLETVFKNILRENKGMVRFNTSNIFNFDESKRLQDTENAFLMPGYASNVVLTETGIFLRVLFKSKFINGNTCLERIHQLGKQYKNGEYKNAIRDEFIKKSIMATYGTHRVYKIDEITFDANVVNKTIRVKDKSGEKEITLKQYYKEQYSKEITQNDQPLFISYKKTSKGDQESVFLIPELFYLTGLTEEMRSQESMKKNMVSRTKVTPKERLDRIYDFRKLIYKQNTLKRTRVNRMTGEEYTLPDPNDIREQWGLNIGDFKEFSGRVLEAPEILYKDGASNVSGGKFRGKRVVAPMNLDSNSWVVISSRQNQTTAEEMVKSLKRSSEQLGISVETPKFLSHNARYGQDLVDFLSDQDLTKYKMVMTVVDRNTEKMYGDYKRFLCSKIGVISQNVRKENASKNLSYFSNVLSQMNAKMGGELYKIDLDENLQKKPCMIIGYDSAKHGKGMRKYVMTASYDMNITKYHTEEIVVEYDNVVGPVNSLLRKCLDHFYSLYKIVPQNVILYRSGVSDGEKRSIMNNEVSSIMGLFSGKPDKECYKTGCEIKLCFVIANKRCESKFFEYSNGNVNNPKEGTVVDTQVTGPGLYEFYLQPQFVNMGTATPTHFHCLYDTTGVPLEILENITYRMCYYYWNWSGAIREPACLKFAEVANKFSSTYLNKEVSDKLKNYPYYI